MLKKLPYLTMLLLLASNYLHAQCTASISPTNTSICLGQNAFLTASSGGTSYQWYDGGAPLGSGSDTLQLSGLSPGYHNISVHISFNSCMDSAVAFVLVVNPPVVGAYSNNVCEGGTLQLYSQTCFGCTFSWNGPNGFASTFQNPAIPNVLTFNSGVYTCCVANNGCVVCDTVQVNIQPAFPINASNNSPVCTNDTLRFSADTITGASYSWTGPGGFSSNQQNPEIVVDNTTQGGLYIVSVYNGNCITADTTLAVVCNTVLVNLYNDLNSNCSFDNGDVHPFTPLSVQIDSNGVILDTISAMAGLYYTADGNSGDIFTFQLLPLPGGLTPTCPITGAVSHTISGSSFTTLDMGVECGTSNLFDLGIYASNPISSAVSQSGYIYLTNPYCQVQNATVTLVHSPKYQYYMSSPLPSSTSGNAITWNLSNLSTTGSAPIPIYYSLHYSTAPLLAGDTTYSYFSISPTTGDADPTNNTWTKHDTVVASQDPNAIMAYPASCIEAGDELQYTIMFENVGNAPAENIYVLDTLPQELNANTMELMMSSHNMYVQKTVVNGNTIFKFDFPDINLPDSSDHAGCHGMLVYKIKTDGGLPLGANIDHRAGIYFDYNAVVMTNTWRSNICDPASVAVATKPGKVNIYPNPARNQLVISTERGYEAYQVSNTLGQVLLQGKINSPKTNCDISALPAGLYHIKISGSNGQETLKFIKQ